MQFLPLKKLIEKEEGEKQKHGVLFAFYATKHVSTWSVVLIACVEESFATKKVKLSCTIWFLELLMVRPTKS